MEPSFIDLHAHASLPVLGGWWRRRQAFSLSLFDAPAARGEEAASASGGGGGPPPSAGRIHMISLYETFLFRRSAARGRVMAALERLARLAPPPGAALLRRSADLDGTYREGYLLAVESLRHVGDPADLARFRELGVRSLQPIHFLDTPWGRSSREGALPPSSRGLSGLGREMLDEMGRLGFILDLAHMNDRTAEESLLRYRGPVMCSHTGLRELRPSARNLPAALAREIFRRGGAVGVTCWRRLLGPLRGAGEREAWTRAFCGTAAALAALSPGARVCVGSDRGAPIRAPGWFFTPGHLAEIGAELAGRGWDAGAVRGFLRGHARDFLASSLPP